MPDGIGQAAGDIGSAYINQATAEATAKEQAQAQEQLYQQAFLDQTNYASNQEQGLRDAILGISSGGNQYAAAAQNVSKTPTQAPGSGMVYGGGSGTPVGNNAGMYAGMTQPKKAG